MKIPNGIKNKKGFVILYAVVISSMLLAIALSVADIAFKEVKFGTSARDTNDAFFAADVGAECALFYDRILGTNNAFTGTFDADSGTAGVQILCSGFSITISESLPKTFIVPQLGNSLLGCAMVTVDKSDPPLTTLSSKGYNNGSGGTAPDWTCIQGANTVERQVELQY